MTDQAVLLCCAVVSTISLVSIVFRLSMICSLLNEASRLYNVANENDEAIVMMTMRDQFATRSPPAPEWYVDEVSDLFPSYKYTLQWRMQVEAMWRYECADAMLSTRNQPKQIEPTAEHDTTD